MDDKKTLIIYLSPLRDMVQSLSAIMISNFEEDNQDMEAVKNLRIHLSIGILSYSTVGTLSPLIPFAVCDNLHFSIILPSP